jgi:uncharacterized protein
MSKIRDYIDNIPGAERRFLVAPMELREEGDAKFFIGTAVIFNSPTDLGWYSEEIVSGAFDEVLNADVRGLYNHDPDVVLGRNKSGTMKLIISQENIRFEIRYNPADPDHVRVMEKVKRGDVSECSFAFEIKDAEWETKNSKDHRKVTKIREWYDISLVTYPAYADTSVAARSLESAKQGSTEAIESRNKEIAEDELFILQRELPI